VKICYLDPLYQPDEVTMSDFSNLPESDSNRSPGAMPVQRFVAGAIFLLVAVITSGMLTLESLMGLALPGCGAGSPCAKAAASAWGKIPGIDFPVSHLGLAYFVTMLIGWLASRGGISSGYKAVARLGAAVSGVYVIVLIVGHHLCWYCIITHIANFLFWIVVERAEMPALSRSRLRRLVLIFIILNGVTGFMHRRERNRVEVAQETKRKESTTEIIKSASQPVNQSGGQTSVGGTTAETSAALKRPWKGGFTGRYLLGPAKAPIRLVLLSDYQCIDCNRTEEQLRGILKAHGDIVSVSMKNFPMCTDCNPGAANLHPNACWAARAAEAAGILGGNDGYWKMNNWLFDHHGGFTDDELKAGVVSLKFDYEKFIKVMTGDETMRRVKSDAGEGLWLGLQYTPMVFINGVEFRGVFAANALARTVDELAAKNLPPMNADMDQPPPAMEKVITDWREQPPRVIPKDLQGWPAGPADAKVRVVLWGDFQEPYTAQADGILRGLMKKRGGIRYEFRHYPVNQACNPVGSMTKHPYACRAAAAAEAAGMIGGDGAYWKAHEWLMEHQKDFSDLTVEDTAKHAGINPGQLMATMDDPRVTQAIGDDARVGKAQGLTGIPFILINEKYVPRWILGTEPILDQLIKEAAGEK
jgi:protein-disulfide isomerase/uncharacterized membrane protein